MAAQSSDANIGTKVELLANGDALVVKSGGQIALETGAKLYVGGADVTSDVATGGVAGIAAGYILARGETALDGSNPTPVVTGLTAITGVALTLKGSSAPGVGTSVLTYTTSGGTISVYAWKPTSNADPTLVASTGTETFGWVAIGT